MELQRWITARLANYHDPRSLGSRFRRRRIKVLLKIIEGLLTSKQTVRILDLGGTPAYWRILPAELLRSGRLHITLVNFDSALVIKDPRVFEQLNADVCSLDNIADYSYDIVHSNSVLEHVGSWQRMKEFATHARRLAHVYFVQTPNVWFPIEPHFLCPAFHWLPIQCRAWLLMKCGLGRYPRAPDIDTAYKAVESVNMICMGQLKYLFPDATIISERYCWIRKSMIAVRRG
jgi:hypothetical protein